MAQRYHLNLDDFTEARTWLERAIALDPGYAAPYALLADWYSIRVGQGWSTDPAADYAEVIRLATAAYERDSFDAMALALCGHVKSLLLHKFDDAIAVRPSHRGQPQCHRLTRAVPPTATSVMPRKPSAELSKVGCRRSMSTSSSRTPSWACALRRR
jgi:hypothetical protein